MTDKTTKTKATLEKLLRYFQSLLEEQPDFHGSIKVNFFNGHAPNINREECVRLE